MLNIEGIVWELFFEKKNNRKLTTRIGFSKEKPRIGENYHLKAGILDKEEVKMLKMETSIVREVHRINPVFMQVRTKYADFIVSNKEIEVELTTTPPTVGDKIDEIVYCKDTVYICKKNDKYLYVVTA